MTARIYTLPGGLVSFSARTHTWTDDELRDVVARLKLGGIINLWHTSDVRASALVAEYHLIPMPDGRMTIDCERRARDAARIAAKASAEHGPVLVHCWGGKNRSGLVAGMAYMQLTNSPGRAAFEAVKAARRGALSNPHFAKWLQEA